MGDNILRPELQDECYIAMEDLEGEDMMLSSDIKNEDPLRQSVEFCPITLDLMGEDKPLTSFCRLCATSSEDMIDMFEPTEMHKNIREQIEYCLPIAVKITDELPKKACQLCLAKLEFSYQFHKNVVEAEKRLLRFHERTSTKRNKKTDNYPQTFRQNDAIKQCVRIDSTGANDAVFSSNNAERDCRARNGTSSSAENSSPHSDGESGSNEELSDSEPWLPPNTKGQYEAKKSLSKEESGQQDPLRNASAEQIRTQKPSINDDVKLNHNYECTMCKRRFGSLRVLEIHKETCCRTVSKEKQYTCDYCGKSLMWRSSMVFHIRSHTGELLYNCEFCPKKFTRKVYQVNHLKTHTGEQPYCCDLCPKKFKRKSYKDSHQRTHTGERPYPCNFCDKMFVSTRSRSNHHRTHTGERPYECSVCKMSFTHESTRRSHMVTHTNAKPHQCNFCKKWFGLRKSLLHHKKICQNNV